MVPKTRTFSSSPAARWLHTRRGLALPIGATWAFLLGFNTASGGWPAWVTLTTFGVLLAVELATLVAPLTHRRLRRTLRALHQRLPSLATDLVTWVRPEQVGELRGALGALDVTVHELDGTTIGSVAELVTALGARFGARTFPSDPLARAVTTLAALPGRTARVHAVVWNGAERFATADPAALHSLLSAWRLELPPNVLLFLVAPAPVAAGADVERGHDRPPVEPDVAVLAAAPSRAWWRLRLGDRS